jgi:hypothetical protein
MATLDFDAQGVDPAKPFEVLPKGKYNVIVSDTEMKQTKSGDGWYLEVEYTVLDGEYEKRRVWSRHNISNPNAKAEQIARQELSAICHSVGMLKITDSVELHDRPLMIELGIEKNKQNDSDVNHVRAWMAAAGGTTPSQPKPAAPAAGAKAPPPWATKKAAA